MDEAQREVRPWWKIALVTVPAIMLLGSASGWLSNSGYGNLWFDGLEKPAFMPPGWAFGVVWPILYAFMGAALAMILTLPPSAKRRNALTFFFIQLALNFAWSPIFFALHDMRAAQIVIFLMIVFAAGAAGQFYRLRKAAGMLLVPYLAWLVFASMLNTAILNLNPGSNVSLLG